MHLLPCSVVENVDDYVLKQGRVSSSGTATHFAYDQNANLTSSTGPCTWSCGAAAIAAAGGSSSSGAADTGAGNALVYQAYPDMSYCRVPRNLKALVESGKHPSVMFEGGTVLR
jgi:hypothetical protein